MQSEFEGVVVVGVTEAPVDRVQQFQVEQGINYAILADAESMFEAYGVKAVWGSVVYLIDSDGKIVARGIEEIRKQIS
jgi:peroxiredoxin